MGWHFIEADATVTLHVLPAVDLEVTVGVDRDQDWTNVGLGGSEEESQNFLPEAPDPSFPLSPASVFSPAPPPHTAFPLEPHVNEVLPEPSPQVLNEGCLTGKVLQQHEILYPYSVAGGQCTLHGHPYSVTAQGLLEMGHRRGSGPAG